jgi:hypothetical protein
MTDIASFGGYMISTLLDKRRGGIYSIAFCPICDAAEESHDQGNGQKHAITDSIVKVRDHMRLRHRIKDTCPSFPHSLVSETPLN